MKNYQMIINKLKKELEDVKCQKVKEALRVRALEANLKIARRTSSELRQELEKLKEKQSLWKRIKSKLKN